MNSLNNITISKLQALATLSIEKVGGIANTTDFNCNFEVHDSLGELRMVHSNIKYLDWNEKYVLRQIDSTNKHILSLMGLRYSSSNLYSLVYQGVEEILKKASDFDHKNICLMNFSDLSFIGEAEQIHIEAIRKNVLSIRKFESVFPEELSLLIDNLICVESEGIIVDNDAYINLLELVYKIYTSSEPFQSCDRKFIDQVMFEEAFRRKIKKAGFDSLNVLLVGVTGVGKSSTLNALYGEEIAKIGESVDPETMSIDCYKLNEVLQMWDSPGLGDGINEDKKHEKVLINHLCKTYRYDNTQYGFIDLVLVILDGSSRDMGTTYRLLEQAILKNIQPERVIVAINKADMAMSGRYWDRSTNQPEEKLLAFLQEKATSVQNRLYEATSLRIKTPIYYSAEKYYNLTALMDNIYDHIPNGKRCL